MQNEPDTCVRVVAIDFSPIPPSGLFGINALRARFQILTLTIVYSRVLITLITSLGFRVRRDTCVGVGEQRLFANKGGTPTREIRARACERTRARISGGDCRFRNNVVEGKGRGGGGGRGRTYDEVGRGVGREGLARDATVERKKREVARMRVCAVSGFAHVRTHAPYTCRSEERECVGLTFRNFGMRAGQRGGERCYPGKKKI